MVAMNPQTWDKDVAEIEPGGYLFYDSTKPMPPSKFRDDITVIGMPLTEICNAAYTDPRQRQLFKNIIYVGALVGAARASIWPSVEKLIGEQYKGKEKLLDAQHARRCTWGATTRCSNLDCPIGLTVQPRRRGRRPHLHRRQRAPPRSAAVYGGATVCAWYPITPSSSLAEAFTRYCSKLPRRSGDRQEHATPSSRPKTSWPRSAW